MSGSRRGGWRRLVAGLALTLLVVLALNEASTSAGDVVARSREEGLEAGAYFYTEVDDVQAFLGVDGRYGRQNTDPSDRVPPE